MLLLNVPLEQKGAVIVPTRLVARSSRGPVSGSWDFTMSNGDRITGSVGTSDNEWAYITPGDTLNRETRLGSSTSTVAKSGTCFGKDMTNYRFFSGVFLIP